MQINPYGAAKIGLVVKGAASQTANLQEWQNSSGTVLARITSTGTISGTNGLSATGGSITGVNSQANGIGGVSAGVMWYVVSGSSGYRPLVLQAAASQTGDLTAWQDSAGTVINRINSAGHLVASSRSVFGGATSIVSGVIVAAVSQEAGAIPFVARASASQTADLTQWQNSAGTVLAKVDKDGNFNNQSTFGNVSTTSVAATNGNITTTYGFYNNLPASTDAGIAVMPWAASIRGAIVRGFTSQTANLQEWQNSAGTVVTRVSSDARIFSTQTITAGNANDAPAALNAFPQSASLVGLVVKGLASQTGNLQQWQDSTGAVLSRVTASGSYLTSARISAGSTTVATGNINSYISSASLVGILVQGAASQTANLQEWQDSAGTVIASVSSSGAFISNSSFLTGGTLRGTGSLIVGGTTGISSVRASIYTNSTTTVGLVIQGAASQTANLQEWQNSSGTVLANITPAGKIAMKHINGISGDMLSLGSNGASDILVVGYDNISAVTYINGGSYGPIQVQLNSAANGKFVVKGAASQTANLQEWQNSSGTSLVSVSSSGDIFSSSRIVGFRYGRFGNDISYTDDAPLRVSSNGASTVVSVIKGAASQTADLQQWQNSSGTVLTKIHSGGDVTLSTGRLMIVQDLGAQATIWSGSASRTALFVGGSTSAPSAVIRAQVSQTANLQEWQDSAGNVMAKVSNTGIITSTTGVGSNFFTNINGTTVFATDS